MAMEMVPKYPISVEHDRDMRSREHLLCIANAKTEIVTQGASLSASQVQTFEPGKTVTVLRVPYEEVGMFALNLVNSLAASGVQMPSLNGEVKRLEERIKAQEKEIEFLRGIAIAHTSYHTSFGGKGDET